MRRFVALLGSAALLFALGSPALAKTDAKKATPVLRCAHSYADALAEAKDRGCVVFATFHEDG